MKHTLVGIIMLISFAAFFWWLDDVSHCMNQIKNKAVGPIDYTWAFEYCANPVVSNDIIHLVTEFKKAGK